jgi:photosystem II stability/assembly factor-like uncharacterized protein
MAGHVPSPGPAAGRAPRGPVIRTRSLGAALLLAAALLLPRAAAHTPHDVIEAWAMSPAFPTDRTLFVALPRFNLLLRSTDAGETWTSCVKGLDSAYVSQLAVSPAFATDRTLWCVEIAGLFVSRDAGESWEKVAQPAEMKTVTALAVTSAADGQPLVATVTREGQLWLSHDGGRTFAHATEPERLSGARCDPVLAAASGSITVVCGGRCLVTLDHEGEWFLDPSSPLGKQESHRVRALAISPAEPWRLWLSADELMKPWARRTAASQPTTVTAGEWRAMPDFPSDAEILHLSVAFERDIGTVLFASTADHGVQIKRGDGPWSASLDGFREPTHQTKQHWLGTMVSPGWAEDHTVYACAFEGLYVSTDGGEHWRWLNTLHPQLVRNLALSPRFADDGALWLSTYGVGLQHSQDRGATFTRIDTQAWDFPDGIAVSRDWRPATADAPAAGALLIGTPNNMLLSRDGGATVAPCLPGAKGFPRALAFAPDWETSGIAFAHLSTDTGLKTNRFVRTADHGATWSDTSVRTVYDIACAPDWATSGRCWIASPDGLFRSDDRGVTFAKVESMPAAGLNSVAVAPGAEADGPPCLAVVSLGRGIFVSRDGGATWESPGKPPTRPTCVRLSPGFAGDGLLLVGTHTDGVWVSRDGGASWRPGAGGPRMVLCMEISPSFARDQTLVVGSYEGPWLSADAGATWRALDVPVPEGFVPEASREPGEGAVLPPAPHGGGR